MICCNDSLDFNLKLLRMIVTLHKASCFPELLIFLLSLFFGLDDLFLHICFIIIVESEVFAMKGFVSLVD